MLVALSPNLISPFQWASPTTLFAQLLPKVDKTNFWLIIPSILTCVVSPILFNPIEMGLPDRFAFASEIVTLFSSNLR